MSKRGEYYEMVMAQSLMEIGEDGEEYNPSGLRKRRTTSRTVSHEPPEVGFRKRDILKAFKGDSLIDLIT